MSTHTFFSLCVPSPVATVQETKWDAEREKPCINLTLMLVRRTACKTSAGSSKILRWLTPLLGPNLDPNPILGSIFGPKNGVSHRRISLLPAHVVQADLRPCSLNMNVNSYLFLFVRPKSGCYCTRNKVGRRERKTMY